METKDPQERKVNLVAAVMETKGQKVIRDCLDWMVPMVRKAIKEQMAVMDHREQRVKKVAEEKREREAPQDRQM
jgi:hypothetical protein